jgi:hypothetical protein
VTKSKIYGYEIDTTYNRRVTTGLFFFIVGCVLNCYAYESLKPILAAGIWVVTLMLLLATRLGGPYERLMFWFSFSISWFFAGISALYVYHSQDPSQIFNDAGNFYALTTREGKSLSLDEIKILTEGAGAVLLWQYIYNFFFSIGFEKARYIGILVNAVAVAISGVFTIKMARSLAGNNTKYFNRLIFLFSTCGMFWMFASLHLRDGVVLLGVTSLLACWIFFLIKRTTKNFIVLIIANVAGFISFGLLRTEFVFVPVAFLMAGLFVIIFVEKAQTAIKRLQRSFLIIFGIALITTAFVLTRNELVDSIIDGYETYTKVSKISSGDTGAESSLGYALIVTQPPLIRLFVGFIYMYIFPIPFWTGFQLTSALPLFRSLNVIYFFCITPLVLMAVKYLFKNKVVTNRSTFIFLILVSIGFTIAIVMTSLEMRHFGTFLVPVILLAGFVELENIQWAVRYKRLLQVYLLGIAGIHMVWLFLKLSG